MKQVLLEPAYVLHRRPYRESSLLIEFFTPTYGRLTAVAKGVRKARSPLQGLLQPFIPLCVSWVGRNELMTLSYVESTGELKRLQGDCLFAGLYLNELLMGLLQKWDAHPVLYQTYEHTLVALYQEGLQQKILRSFEKYLLATLGYGLLSKSDIALQNSLSPDKYYRFVPEQGFTPWAAGGEGTRTPAMIFSGKNLLAYAKEDWQDEESLQEAKRLSRCLLGSLLGSRPIHSRKLFKHLQLKEEEE